MLVYEFVLLVKSTRGLQTQYFKSRSPELLQHCKAMERELDQALRNIEMGELTGSFPMKPTQKALEM